MRQFPLAGRLERHVVRPERAPKPHALTLLAPAGGSWFGDVCGVEEDDNDAIARDTADGPMLTALLILCQCRVAQPVQRTHRTPPLAH
ncbi:hypothetical protein BIV57_00815 [Mangrovactinospora gilvigrisea]|uniref:Uncharacterized protein n=1 Tax=Mangrovactinospora gilvigrisea TaxID=1428644 RepID=A0A1J7BL47_9ACTN|nr:hypothetical protein BIV57_00815 [Mangrovactinospora gilvigrisea]